jgi:hypothetical protein
MRIKQKWVMGLLSIVFLAISSLALPVFTLTTTVHAEYAPGAGNKCQDGSDATKRTNRTTQATEYFCADTTKSNNPQTPTTQTGDTTTGSTAATTDSDKGVTCAVEKIGWIVCPIMEGAAKISDKAFDILADNFLHVDTQLFDDKSGTKVAWEVARNLGNIMFIIAFLVIIVSQVTGRGLNNYGIKKMLPRLIVAAIAVNVSYYICQLAVDLTNILGYEIQKMMEQIANTVGPSVFGSAASYADTQTANTAVFQDGALLTLIVTGALAVGAVVWFMLPTLAALIPLILITVMVIIIILLLRKALIVLLIVLSPIAFVMYLLPNTEKYFSKWMSMFGKLLMVFPTVGLLFGAGQLASTIVLVSASSSGDGTSQAKYAAQCKPDDKTSKDQFEENKKNNPSNNSICGEGSITIQGGKDGATGGFGGVADKSGQPKTATWTTGLIAMGIAVAPLLAVWSVLQGALSAAGAIGGKITSAVSKGINSSVKGGVGAGKKAYEGSSLGIGRQIRQAGKQNFKRRRVLDSLGKENAGGIDKFRQVAAGGIPGALEGTALNIGSIKAQNEAIEKTARAQNVKAKQEEIQDAESAINSTAGGDMGKIVEALAKAEADNDVVSAKAAQNLLFGMGGAGVDEFVKQMKNKSGEVADALAENTRLKHGNIKGTHAGLNEWANSGKGGTIEAAMGRASAYSNLSADNIAGQSFGSLGAMKGAMKSAMDIYNDTSKTVNERNTAVKEAMGIQKAAQAALQSKALEGAKVGNKAIIDDLANLRTS